MNPQFLALGLVAILACPLTHAADASKKSKDGAKPFTLRGEPIRSTNTPSTLNPNTIVKTPKSLSQVGVTNNESTVSLPGGDFLSVGFDKLSNYQFELTDDILAPSNKVLEAAATLKTTNQIPASVRGFDKKRIALKGFMLPLKVEGGLVTELLIMRDQSMCCYGAVPKINEWVSVKTPAGGGVKPIMDEPVTILGTLHVGEIRENGYLVGIYRMDGEKLVIP